MTFEFAADVRAAHKCNENVLFVGDGKNAAIPELTAILLRGYESKDLDDKRSIYGESVRMTRGSSVDHMRVYYDAFAKTLTVWLADSESEVVCEEADNDTVFMKDRVGHIIGFERLNVDLAPGFTIEVVNLPTSSH